MPLPINNDQTSLALTQFFPLSGIFPSPDGDSGGIPLGSIRTFAGNFAFGGSFTAEGQVLSISQNTAVFSLLGTTYGGNGTSNFALPDLDGRTMIGVGQGFGLDPVQLGVPVGSSQLTLVTAQLPANVGGSNQPFNNYQDSLPIHYLIRTEGFFPSENGGTGGNGFMGEIVPFAGTFVPGGFMEAAGQTLQIADHDALFQLIGTTYGGDGMTTFQLPDLRGRTIVGASSSAQSQLGTIEGQPLSFVSNANLPVSAGGSGQPIDNHEPSLALTYLISLAGIFPSPSSGGVDPTQQYLGEVVAFAGDFAPKGWALAQGQLLSISQNTALFSLLGTQYGGNGQTTFALPDLRNRTAIGTGDTAATVGEVLGSNSLTLTSANIPDMHVTGTADANTLRGADGNDVLDGAGGADTMIGGLGNDTYVVDNGGDAVIENANEGTDTVLVGFHFALPVNVENLTLQGSADLQGYGNDLVNVITGNSGNNLLDGRGGADVMRGGAGNDTYFVDHGGDVVTENPGEGTDAVFSTAHFALPANVETLVLQGSADLQGYGNDLANKLFGNSGNNLLNGGAGADIMSGGAGNDTYFVDDAGDIVRESAGEGTDAVFSTAHFVLPANVETLVLQGGTDLQGYGNDLANKLIGNSGNNLLDGGAGADTMRGGAGNDTYFVDNGGDVVVENAGEGSDAVFSTAHFALSANVETLVLQGSADLQGYGNDLANALYGNSGNNILNGQTGADIMFGGLGNDTYFVGGGDGVIENANEGTDTVFSTTHFALSANVENLVLQGSADLQGYGNDLANALYGNTGNNLLNGGTGADIMFGGLGNDTYFVDGGDGVIENTGEGTDTVFSTTHYALSANVENLVLQGSADLQGYGNSQVNTLYGGTGNNLLNGEGGADTMIGGAGDDVYFVDDPGDLVFENVNEGTDAVFSTVDYALSANVEILVLQGAGNLDGIGNGLANQVYGNAGDNALDGGADSDLLNGGAGHDTLTGGTGDDIFAFSSGQADGDSVVDFSGNGPAAGDSLLFTGFGTVAQGASLTRIGASNQWQIHSGLGGPDEIITFMNGAAVDPTDIVFV
jgi:microcystin-dependent protein